MNKIKYLALAFVAALTLAACDDDDEKGVKEFVKTDTLYQEKVKTDTVIVDNNNWSRYQTLVTNEVKKQKKHDKAILLVAFGSTYEQAFDTFDSTIDAYKNYFTGYDVFLSYSSAICINRAAAGENGVIRNYYAPSFWLNAFAAEGVRYDEIIVQSLQVIPGEEYARVISYMKDFGNNANGDLDDDYLASVTLKLGKPLLQDSIADVNKVAEELNILYNNKAQQGVVAFMGHGNPDSYDTFKANVRYTQLEKALQKYSGNYFVGTVDMMGNFKTHVLKRMHEKGITSGKVFLHPLMSIDGDHGHNDMAGDDDAWDNGFKENEEGEVEDTSWKMYFSHMGYECNDNTMINLGLLELESIRNVWRTHTEEAEVVDFYNSKNPE